MQDPSFDQQAQSRDVVNLRETCCALKPKAQDPQARRIQIRSLNPPNSWELRLSSELKPLNENEQPHSPSCNPETRNPETAITQTLWPPTERLWNPCPVVRLPPPVMLSVIAQDWIRGRWVHVQATPRSARRHKDFIQNWNRSWCPKTCKVPYRLSQHLKPRYNLAQNLFLFLKAPDLGLAALGERCSLQRLS